jgi:hypothetical protein
LILILATLWLSFGCFSMILMASEAGYLRWSDLMVIPLGPIWFCTSYWWDEDGRKLWVRGVEEDEIARRKCRREGHVWCVGFDPVTFAPKRRTCSRCLRHESACVLWWRKS